MNIKLNLYSILLHCILLGLLIGADTSSLSADASEKPWGLGFVEIDNQFPLALNHSSFRPLSPEVVERSAVKLNATLGVSNSFILKKNKYSVDGEYRVSTFKVAYGLTDSLELGGRISTVWRGGGYLDSFVDDFHKILGFPRGTRAKNEEDKFGIFGVNEDGTGFLLTDRGLELSDAVLSAKYLVLDGSSSESALSFIGELRLPTASNDSYGQDALDLTLGFVTSSFIEPIYIYWGGAYILYGDKTLHNIVFQRHHVEGFGGIEYPFTDSFSINAAIYLASPLVESIAGFPGYALYLDTGLKYKISENNRLEFVIRENPAPSDSTADFTIVMGLEHTIR